ncbi:MAG: hypothetical protein AB1540_00210 [Bdellovibrionota bacterium]
MFRKVSKLVCFVLGILMLSGCGAVGKKAASAGGGGGGGGGDSSSGSSGSSGGSGSSGPTVASVSIDAGAASTTTTSVSVAFTTTGTPVEICIRNDTTVASCVWDADITSPNAHTLASGLGSKTVYVWVRDAGGTVSSSGSDTIALSCPTNFVAVPGSVTYSTADFCLAKFEMKAVLISSGTVDADGDITGGNFADYRAEVRTDGPPWRFVTRAQASNECTERGWALPTNDQWQTVARNVESVAANWSGLAVGSGRLAQGNSDGSPAASVSISDLNDPYDQTGNAAVQAPGGGWEQRRTHTLSNNEEIWDLAGNVWEWTSNSIDGSTLNPALGGNAWREYSDTTYFDFTHTANRLLFGPLADSSTLTYYDSNNGMGTIFGGTGGALSRSGSWQYGTANAGVFTASLWVQSNFSLNDLGFRCVATVP